MISGLPVVGIHIAVYSKGMRRVTTTSIICSLPIFSRLCTAETTAWVEDVIKNGSTV